MTRSVCPCGVRGRRPRPVIGGGRGGGGAGRLRGRPGVVRRGGGVVVVGRMMGRRAPVVGRVVRGGVVVPRDTLTARVFPLSNHLRVNLLAVVINGISGNKQKKRTKETEGPLSLHQCSAPGILVRSEDESLFARNLTSRLCRAAAVARVDERTRGLLETRESQLRAFRIHRLLWGGQLNGSGQMSKAGRGTGAHLAPSTWRL